jgi:uncharacterized protein
VSPALIVFCREPIAGETKTRLIGPMSSRAAAALADAFIRDALRKARIVKPSKLIIAASSPRGAWHSRYFLSLAREFDAELMEQGDGSLGQRMARALRPCADKGALLIGTDTPSVPIELLVRCLATLARRRVLISPSLDGGYWAVGVRGAVPPIFNGIRWGGSGVLAATLKRLKQARLAYVLGPAWYDIDRWDDVVLLARHLELISRATKSHPCPATAAFIRGLKASLLGVSRGSG